MHLEAAYTLKPDGAIKPLLCDVWMETAKKRLARGDTVAALGALTRAIERDARNPEPVNLAGIIYFRLGEAERAQKLFEKAGALDSLHSESFFNLGMVHWSGGSYEEARLYWLKALQLSPDDTVVDAQASLAVYLRLPAGVKTLRVYPRCSHELYNDSAVNAQKPLTDLISWLYDRQAQALV